MRLVRSRLVLIGAAGLLLLIVLRLLSHTRTATSRQASNKTESGGLRLPRMDLYIHGKDREWTLTAVNVTASADQRFFHCSGIRDGKFFQAGKVAAHFTAGAAVFDQSAQNLDLTGPIHVDGVDDVHLVCGSLHYAYGSGHLTAIGPLSITTPESRFTAGYLKADLGLNELQFESTARQPVLLTARLGAQDSL
ncbi:MAG TPA: hypothetical protein VFJ58_19360 [Armatimonadota bacterium]|nr:hypothetical protein [Armatimonadota bacterium]